MVKLAMTDVESTSDARPVKWLAECCSYRRIILWGNIRLLTASVNSNSICSLDLAFGRPRQMANLNFQTGWGSSYTLRDKFAAMSSLLPIVLEGPYLPVVFYGFDLIHLRDLGYLGNGKSTGDGRNGLKDSLNL